MKITRKAVFIAIGVIALGSVAFFAYVNHQLGKLPMMTFKEMLHYTTVDRPDARITVGIIQNGEASFTVYGENGEVLPHIEHLYEIGSLTKTFTASLIFQSINDLNATIDQYLELPKGDYPTIKQLLTHTSGYKNYYFESPMIGNFFHGRNDYYGISEADLLARIALADWQPKEGEFRYSNFAFAVLGAVLAEVHQQDFADLMDGFAQELGLPNTRISDGTGDLANYWDWQKRDAYLAAGGLVSTIGDMLQYAKLQLEGRPEQGILEEIDYEKMGIRMDAIGGAWLWDKERQFIWHNGGTDHFNSYLGFSLETGTAVIILSNLPPGYRIPATVMGVRLLAEIQQNPPAMFE